MKKFFLSLLFILFTVSSFAQFNGAQFNVYARMFAITKGKPQKIVFETTGEAITFDQQGRITSYSMGTDEIRYSWNGDKITLTAYQNGNKLGEEYMTVTANTSNKVSISMPGGTVTETYRANGSEEKSVITSNGQSMTETCYYKSDSDVSPYKYTLSVQGHTETFDISGYQYDAMGNWIKRTINNNGQSLTEIRTITYYK